MNIDTFFDIASPTTLASLIADVEIAGKGASSQHRQLEREANRLLVANVGPEEAEAMIAAAAHVAD